MCQVQDPASVGIDSGISKALFNLDEVTSMETPGLLSAHGDSAAATLTRAIFKLVADDTSSIETKMGELISYLIADEKEAGDIHAGTSAGGSFKGFQWQVDGVGEENQPFEKMDVYAKHLVNMAEVGKHDCSVKSLPLAGCAGVIYSMTGLLSVILVPEAKVDTVGVDLALWLQSVEGDAIAGSKIFVLKEKEAVWVPFGWFPFILGLAVPLAAHERVNSRQARVVWPQKGQKRAVDFRGYVVMPCFHVKLSSSDAKSASKLLARLGSSQDFLPKLMVKDAAFKQYLNRLEQCAAPKVK